MKQLIHLIPMTEFVNRINELVPRDFGQDFEGWQSKQLSVIKAYAKFLSQPLELGMFVPCDEYGNPFKGKPLSPASDEEWDRWEKEQEHFFEAKERVMFEGFELKGRELYHNETNLFWVFTSKDFDMSHVTIEQLLNNYKNEMVFTPNALKKYMVTTLMSPPYKTTTVKTL